MGYSFDDFLDDVSPVGNFIGKEIDKTVSLPGQIVGGVSGFLNNIVNTAGSTLTNLGQSLSMPLLVAGGAVILIMMNKK